MFSIYVNYFLIFCISIICALGLEVIRRKIFVCPTKPLLTCILDAALVIPYYFKLGPFKEPNDVNQAVLLAIKSTKLSDFSGGHDTSKDTSSFIERYQIARRFGLERSQAVYSPTGYLITLNTLQKRMESRLLLVEYIKKHPEVLDVPFHRAPIFTIGFPRTGTTFLHELLGLHPEVRMHYTWEQMSPVPATDLTTQEALSADRKERYLKNKSRMDFMLGN